MAFPIVGQFAFRHVPFDARQEMADILDPPSSCGLSWVSFAERLNRYSRDKLFFNTTKLNAIGSRQGSPTLEVFQIIASSNVITTDIVQQVLIEMSSAATDVLPRFANVIATNASNEIYHTSKSGRHHNCHCDSCINYCDCDHHKHQNHSNTAHCGHIGNNGHRGHCSHNRLCGQPENFSRNGTVNQMNRLHNTNPVQTQMYRDQERNTRRCNFQNPYRGYMQNTQHHLGHQQQRRPHIDVCNDQNNDLGHTRIPDYARQNVAKCQNIELTENSSRRLNQHISSCMTTTSNNQSESVHPSESLHHFENDSAIIQTQNQILNENQLQSVCEQLTQLSSVTGIGLDRENGCRHRSNNNGIDEEPDNFEKDPLQGITNEDNRDNIDIKWIPPEDVESDSDSSMTEISSDNSHNGISQSRQRMHEIRQSPSHPRAYNTVGNGNIQSQSGMDNTRNQSQPQVVPMRHNIEKTSGSHDNAQCTCLQEEQRHSLPVMRPHPPYIRKKCASESDIDQHTGRRQMEEIACTCRKPLKVFTSFAVDDTKHLKEVLEMQKTLHNKGYLVRSDMNEGTFQKKMANSHDWLVEEFQSADYVIFCISPEFYEYIQPDFKESSGAFPANSRLHTRFIFDLARTEYIENGSKNKRFLPVIFTNSGANIDHLPKFMHATIIYYYPETFDRLLSVLDDNILVSTFGSRNNVANTNIASPLVDRTNVSYTE